MRLFVTGGTGFLGSHFLRRAVEGGYDCLALRRPDSKPPQIPTVRWIEGELGDELLPHLTGCDAVVHLASAGVSPQPVTWERAMDVNVHQATHLLTQAVQAGITKLLLCGSCFEYGLSGNRFEFIPADAPLEPVGPYASSKAAFSTVAEAFARTAEASLVLLRPFHFFGEGQHESNFWPSLRRAALAGEDFPMTPGEQIRDFQPVDETADGFLKVLAKWPGNVGKLEVANLGSGRPISLKDFARQWWTHFGATGRLGIGGLPYRFGEVMRFVPEIAHQVP